MLFNFFPSLLLASISTFQPSIVQDTHGNRVVLWLSLDESVISIHASMIFKNGDVIPSQVLSTRERDVVSAPKIEINQLGQMLVVWNSYDSKVHRHCLEAVTYSNDLGWSPAVVLSDSSYEDVKVGDFQLSLDDEGHIAIVWTSLLNKFPVNPQIRLTVAALGQSWALPTTISNIDEK
jgi:hypothetical protein